MRTGLILMVLGVLLLLLGGIPAVLRFIFIQTLKMDVQMYTNILNTPLFYGHWFLMVYGFFMLLIGNEILIALSREWSGKIASNEYILFFGIMVVLATLLYDFLRLDIIPFILEVMGLLILLKYSAIYLTPSKIGLRPILYNYLIVSTLIITIFVIIFQMFYRMPQLAIIFPTAMIFAVMSRDIGLVLGGSVVNQKEMSISYIFLVVGILLHPFYFYLTSFFLISAWIISVHATKIYTSRGIRYSKIHLATAWIWLLTSAILSWSYDAYIHTITIGFLFNTIFGVDVVLIDLLLGILDRRLVIKRSYIPYLLVNVGTIMRVVYDLNIMSPLLLLATPLQGIGILSFYLLMFSQIFLQRR
ncbi:MAG: nitric oxide response protein [Thermoprotei archaeon]